MIAASHLGGAGFSEKIPGFLMAGSIIKMLSETPVSEYLKKFSGYAID